MQEVRIELSGKPDRATTQKAKNTINNTITINTHGGILIEVHNYCINYIVRDCMLFGS